MYGHILYPGFSQRSERLLVHGQLLQLVQRFQAVNDPVRESAGGFRFNQRGHEGAELKESLLVNQSAALKPPACEVNNIDELITV